LVVAGGERPRVAEATGGESSAVETRGRPAGAAGGGESLAAETRERPAVAMGDGESSAALESHGRPAVTMADDGLSVPGKEA
jgi:3-deoxy-D-manno-octulosonic acid (KDO) 8-phosphate synthase